MTDFDAVFAQVFALGTTADEVAATLAVEGIKGKREYADCCPISEYVKTRWQWAFIPSTSERQLELVDEEGDVIEREMPAALRDFVRHFDQGAYPDLDATKADA